MNTAALLDEVVVIDSDSTDDSYAVATGAGAIVHRVADIRPDLGWCGAREAMWNPCSSLPVTCSSSWTPIWSTGTPTSCPACSDHC
jgi:hypothetical protein